MTPWRIFQTNPDDGQKLPVRVLVAFAALVAAFAFSLFAVAAGVVANSNRIDDIERVRQAVCNLRADQIRRIAVTEKFLRVHPEGFSGIDPAILRSDLRDRKRVIDALAPLHCE